MRHTPRSERTHSTVITGLIGCAAALLSMVFSVTDTYACSMVFSVFHNAPVQEGEYKDPRLLVPYHQRWGQYQFRLTNHRRFDASFPLPTLVNSPDCHTFGSTLEGKFSIDNGASFTQVTLDNIPTTTCVTLTGTTAGVEHYTTEITQLSITSGLPPGFLLRESPTRPSSGTMNVTPQGGNFLFDGSFTVFTELSPDGGATWIPSTDPSGNPVAGQVRLTTPGGANVPTLSVWGVLGLTLMLLTAAVILIASRRRSVGGTATAG